MSAWDDMLAADAPLFTDPDGFGGEAVVYSPKGGTPRTVNAQVERFEPEPDGQGIPRPKARVTLRNHATAGVLASAVDPGGDTITLAIPRGGTAREYGFGIPAGIEWADPGTVTLDLS